uniref:Uncharacterized protein n=1 Tax=Romanomermis culicivorax TaxID=13658 RepID=A0A915K137_ROMCU
MLEDRFGQQQRQHLLPKPGITRRNLAICGQFPPPEISPPLPQTSPPSLSSQKGVEMKSHPPPPAPYPKPTSSYNNVLSSQNCDKPASLAAGQTFMAGPPVFLNDRTMIDLRPNNRPPPYTFAHNVYTALEPRKKHIWD